MKEAFKTNKIRSKDFFERYLSGKVLDIGAGDDLVCPSAERFDVEDGDANNITLYKSNESYDAIHSSHCLEHMIDPRNALSEWWKLLKPGGYLILVVPDEDLYEQGIWPSFFNSDHKNTFTLNKQKSWSPVSWNVLELVEGLDCVEVISAEVQDKYYDYTLLSKNGEMRIPLDGFLYKLLKGVSRLLVRVSQYRAVVWDNYLFRRYGIPVDQTMRDALAQIQIVAKKRIDY